MKPTVLIITGYGLNCEAESRFAWETAGAQPHTLHIRDLMGNPRMLRECKALMFIGGFSFGDHMTSGLVFAHLLRHHLEEELQEFISSGGLILGVCNGFQIMAKLGLVPGLQKNYFSPSVSLMQNACGAFQNFWIRLRFEQSSPCIFTRGLDFMDLPIRHGEGNVIPRNRRTLEELEAAGCVACRYVNSADGEPARHFPANPNGSVNAIAGLCDPTGRIFGLMPHPEAFLFPEQHPLWTFRDRAQAGKNHGDGLRIFENAVRFMREQ